MLRAVRLVGGPVPYREALTIRLDAAEIRVADEEVEAVVVFAASECDWDVAGSSAGDLATVVVIPELDLDHVVRALALGAGVVHLDTPTEIMVDVIRAAVSGEALVPLAITKALAAHLPPSRHDIVGTSLEGLEVQIADALIADKSVGEIARELHYSDRTIRRKLQGIYLKLGVQDRPAAVERLRATTMAKIDDGPAK